MFTEDEAHFIRTTVKDKLSDLNLERQKQASESAASGQLVSTLLLEDKLAVAESAWAKLKREL